MHQQCQSQWTVTSELTTEKFAATETLTLGSYVGGGHKTKDSRLKHFGPNNTELRTNFMLLDICGSKGVVGNRTDIP